MYIEDGDKIEAFINSTKNIFDENFDTACKKMAEVTGKPLYRNNFTIFVTTFPRGPYNKEKGYLWVYTDWLEPLKSFLHELCHFQFIHYWGENNNSDIMKLSNDEFGYLKESLTVVIDESFYPLIKSPDRGYEIHQGFRKILSEHWKKDKDFDHLVKFGINELPKYIK